MQPDDAFVPEAHRVLAAYARLKKVSFFLGPVELPADEVFAPEGLLPLIVLRAHERMREHASVVDAEERANFARGIVMDIVPSDEAMLGHLVNVAPLDARVDPFAVVRMLYLAEAADTILGLDDNAEVDVVPIFEHFSAQPGTSFSGIVKWPLTKIHSAQ